MLHATSPAVAQCRAVSGPATLPLVELYTSEGCDSCPPADRWLRETFPPAARSPGAAALAFHVDYWDALGWRDRFAQHAFTERQQEAMRAHAARTVYTPQVLIQGQDPGLWRSGAVARALRDASSRAPGADIELAVQSAGGNFTVDARATAVQARAPALELHVALTESALASEVTAGENRGVRLVHDHVVRQLWTHALGPNGRAHASFTGALPKERGQHPTLVAFVQDRRSGDVLQSLILPLCM